MAFGLTLAAGLATTVGSLMVVCSRRPNPRLLRKRPQHPSRPAGHG